MSSTNNLYPQAPCFTSSVPPMSAATSQAVATRGTPATLNLDDIFGDCFFTPKGDAVFLSDQVDNDNEGAIVSTESEVATNASRMNPDGVSVPVQSGGGIQTTNLLSSGHNATTMGQSSDQIERPNPIPFSTTPQKEHHLGYISTDVASNKRRRQRPNHERKMSEQQKVERRYVCHAHHDVLQPKILDTNSFHHLVGNVIESMRRDPELERSFFWSLCNNPCHS